MAPISAGALRQEGHRATVLHRVAARESSSRRAFFASIRHRVCPMAWSVHSVAMPPTRVRGTLLAASRSGRRKPGEQPLVAQRHIQGAILIEQERDHDRSKHRRRHVSERAL